MTLTPKQALAFLMPLRARFEADLGALDDVLMATNRRLAPFHAKGDLPRDVITNVIDDADARGWLEAFWLAALAQVPGLRDVGAELGFQAPVEAGVEVGSAPAVASPPALYDPMSVLAFDLVPLEQEFQRAWHASTSRLLGLAVPYGEEPFLGLLCERIRSLLLRERTHVQDRLVLGGRYGGSARRLDDIDPYRFLLERKNLVCPVPAEDATADELDEFWRGVRRLFADPLPNAFVLLFTVFEDVDLPAGVARLPAPEFTGNTVGEWTTQLAKDRRWDPMAGWEWRQFIEERAGTTVGLDVRKVYDYLKVTMPSATFDELRTEIERWRSHAVTTSG